MINLTVKDMQRIKHKLAKQYPPHHHNHIVVFTRYWSLVDAMEMTKEIK